MYSQEDLVTMNGGGQADMTDDSKICSLGD